MHTCASFHYACQACVPHALTQSALHTLTPCNSILMLSHRLSMYDFPLGSCCCCEHLIFLPCECLVRMSRSRISEAIHRHQLQCFHWHRVLAEKRFSSFTITIFHVVPFTHTSPVAIVVISSLSILSSPFGSIYYYYSLS